MTKATKRMFALVVASVLALGCSSSSSGTGGSGSSTQMVCTGIAGGSGTSACSSCSTSKCATATSAFESDCTSFLSCAADCGCGQSCVDGCESQLMTTACEGAANSFGQCLETTCASECETTGTATVLDGG